jgi:2-dehydropantoate 2-reductase
VACLADWLRRAGFDCVESQDIRRDIWFKLLANISLNPISLLTAATSDRIVDDPLVHALCVSMMEETARIGEAIGLAVTASIEAIIAGIQALGAFKSSMLQDVENGKPVEIDALLSVTCDIGRMVGVPTPTLDAVLALARLRAAGLGLLDAAPLPQGNGFTSLSPAQLLSSAAARASDARQSAGLRREHRH